jgi:hypothetical protein
VSCYAKPRSPKKEWCNIYVMYTPDIYYLGKPRAPATVNITVSCSWALTSTTPQEHKNIWINNDRILTSYVPSRWFILILRRGRIEVQKIALELIWKLQRNFPWPSCRPAVEINSVWEPQIWSSCQPWFLKRTACDATIKLKLFAQGGLFIWSKMSMIQRVGMRGGGGSLIPAFQYLIHMVWRPCDLSLVMISSLASKCQDCKLFTLSPTGYKKRTGQFLRVLHVYSIDNFVPFWLKWL